MFTFQISIHHLGPNQKKVPSKNVFDKTRQTSINDMYHLSKTPQIVTNPRFMEMIKINMPDFEIKIDTNSQESS